MNLRKKKMGKRETDGELCINRKDDKTIMIKMLNKILLRPWRKGSTDQQGAPASRTGDVTCNEPTLPYPTLAYSTLPSPTLSYSLLPSPTLSTIPHNVFSLVGYVPFRSGQADTKDSGSRSPDGPRPTTKTFVTPMCFSLYRSEQS